LVAEERFPVRLKAVQSIHVQKPAIAAYCRRPNHDITRNLRGKFECFFMRLKLSGLTL